MIHITPGSTLSWRSLEEWLACAWKLDARKASSARKRLMRVHVETLPALLVYTCGDRKALAECLDLLRCGPPNLAQPPRGQREDAPQTALIVAIKNRLAQLDRLDDLASMPDGHNSRNRQQAIPLLRDSFGPKGNPFAPFRNENMHQSDARKPGQRLESTG